MPTDQVSADAVQPGPSIGLARVVAVALPESEQKGLRDDVVGAGRIKHPCPQPPRPVPLDMRRVPTEQLGELFGLGSRASDKVSVAARDLSAIRWHRRSSGWLLWPPFIARSVAASSLIRDCLSARPRRATLCRPRPLPPRAAGTAQTRA